MKLKCIAVSLFVLAKLRVKAGAVISPGYRGRLLNPTVIEEEKHTDSIQTAVKKIMAQKPTGRTTFRRGSPGLKNI
jgi:hypothetical protein